MINLCVCVYMCVSTVFGVFGEHALISAHYERSANNKNWQYYDIFLAMQPAFR